MLIENRSHKAYFYGDAQNIPVENPKLDSMLFVQSHEPFEAQSIKALETELDITFPALFLEFIKECGGFHADANSSYPCGAEKQPLKVSFDIIDNRRTIKISFTLFDAFNLPATKDCKYQQETLKQCFGDGELYEKELEGRNWKKLLPFADDNGDILCLDFNNIAEDEPQVVYITYDPVGIFFAFNNFRELLVSLDY